MSRKINRPMLDTNDSIVCSLKLVDLKTAGAVETGTCFIRFKE